MAKPTRWIAGMLALQMVSGPVPPPARADARAAPEAGTPRITEASLMLGPACRSVQAREEHERGSCLYSIQGDLFAGRVGLEEALSLLANCTGNRADFREARERHAALRADWLRARAAFGEPFGAAAERELAGLPARPVPAASVARLRAAGITPSGFHGSAALERLRADAALRGSFREVFGDHRADDLERLIDPEGGDLPRALLLGGTVVVPGGSPVAPELYRDPLAEPAAPATFSPRVLDATEYEDRLATDLYALDQARLRYLESAALSHRLTGSARRFVRSLRSPVEADAQATAAGIQAAGDYAVMMARLRNLQLQHGADPLLYGMALEGVTTAAEIESACEELALRRHRWIHAGAGIVTGLVGAAGIVVASGATGTLAGGVTVAAALEAALGAYLTLRTEGVRQAAMEEERERRSPTLPEEETRPFERPDPSAYLGEGRQGEGQGERQALDAEGGDESELEDGVGEEGEEDETEGEELGPRENRVPPVLPPALPEELAELPPMLNPEDLRELRSLSLAEVQERLDEFLAVDAPRARPTRTPEAKSEADERRALIDEARAALRLWVDRRELSAGFGDFFLRAEVEGVSAGRRAETLAAARDRYERDRVAYRGSATLDDLRARIAERLVTHCRTEGSAGDLVLAACTDGTAMSILVVAALREAGVALPRESVLGVQSVAGGFQPVLFSPKTREVYSLTRGDRVRGVVGPIYHPASFYFSFLVEHGVRPDVDPAEHLLIVDADPGMRQAADCAEPRGRGLLGRVTDWLRSLVGMGIPSRRGTGCIEAPPEGRDGRGGEGEQGAGAEREGVHVGVSVQVPRIPMPSMGGGQAGGGSPGGGGGAGGQAGGAGQAGGGSSGGGQGGQGGSSADGGSEGGEAGGGEAGGGAGGAGKSGGQAGGSAQAGGSGGQGGEQGRAGSSGPGGGGTDGGGSGAAIAVAGSSESVGGAPESGDDGEESPGERADEDATAKSGLDLAAIARETVELRKRAEEAGALRVRPWQLRSDFGFTAPNARVLYADNDKALSRFDPGDRFITLSPSDVEEQRRMLDADSYPVFPADATCATRGLPPRKVFRQASPGEPGWRYVFCDQDESLVIFRTQRDARSYSALHAPDRPLYLVRLASEKLVEFERSEEVARIRAFLEDPNALRGFSPEEVDSMVTTAEALLTFQHTLESALVQSMNELETSSVRGYYFDLHRQVFQGPFFRSLSEGVYRLNRRLASDPLRALAWANAQPDHTRQGFFRLYHALGGAMYWPERWEVVVRRYGDPGALERREPRPEAASLDFLQILSDPTRVRVDWRAGQRLSSASIRDRRAREGRERAPDERPHPTEATEKEKQNVAKQMRGGTRGLGRTGEGEGLGPERGKRPLQMINIRLVPQDGDPDRMRLPDNNLTRPGGTRGKKEKTEESASRQEPVLWVSPQTFVDAVLSTWERRELEPESAARIPPLLRFDQRLRRLFLAELYRDEVYDSRLLAAMGVFTSGDWLRFAEVRTAMGGSWVRVKARDTGRFSARYSRTAPINDQDQIRVPNFFTTTGVIVPADLFEPVRDHYTRTIHGIFDLAADGAPGHPDSLRELPLAPGESAEAARASLLRGLRIVEEQARAN